MNMTVNIITKEDIGLKVYQDFGKFNSLNDTQDYGQSVKYESFFVLDFYIDEQHLDMYTYKVEIQQKRRSSSSRSLTRPVQQW